MTWVYGLAVAFAIACGENAAVGYLRQRARVRRLRSNRADLRVALGRKP